MSPRPEEGSLAGIMKHRRSDIVPPSEDTLHVPGAAFWTRLSEEQYVTTSALLRAFPKQATEPRTAKHSTASGMMLKMGSRVPVSTFCEAHQASSGQGVFHSCSLGALELGQIG